MYDDWARPNKQSNINFLVYCAHKSVNASDEVHDAQYFHNLMAQVIDQIGKQNVIQLQIMMANKVEIKQVDPKHADEYITSLSRDIITKLVGSCI